MSVIRIIKKYPNRRLYDTTRGCYITLDDIKELVIQHDTFKVIDARTEKDLTQSTLLQIITEQESSATPIFTNALLQDFIRSYHEKTQNLFTEYLEQAIGLFSQQKSYLEKQWGSYQEFIANNPILTGFAKKPANANPAKKPKKTSTRKNKK